MNLAYFHYYGFFLAILGTAFGDWILSEIIITHLDPIRAQSYFSYSNTAYFLSVLFISLISYFWKPNFEVMLNISVLLVLIIFIFIFIQFVPARNIEVIDKNQSTNNQLDNHGLHHLFIVFGLYAYFLGATN